MQTTNVINYKRLGEKQCPEGDLYFHDSMDHYCIFSISMIKIGQIV